MDGNAAREQKRHLYPLFRFPEPPLTLDARLTMSGMTEGRTEMTGRDIRKTKDAAPDRGLGYTRNLDRS